MYIFLALWFAISGFAARADVPISMRYFEDKSASLSIEDILAKGNALPWQPVKHPVPSFGQSASRFWLRFDVPADRLRFGSEPLFAEITNGYLSKIQLFSVVHGKVRERLDAGLSVGIDQRQIHVLRAGFTVFRLPPPHDPAEEFFLSVEGTLPISVPLQLWEGPDFPLHHWLAMLLVGFYLGCLMLGALSNGVIAASLRSSFYLNYALFIFFMTMICLASSGLTIQLFWPNSPWWAERELFVYFGAALIFYVAFLREFLESRTTAPVLDRLLLFCVGVSTMRSLWLPIAYNQALAVFGDSSSAFANLLALFIAVKAYRRGVAGARLFFIASLVFNISMISFVSQELGFIWVSKWMAWAPFFGTLVEVVLLSLALSDRIRLANREIAFQRAAMVQAEKIAALGRMAGELAHEINNPLAIIHGNAVLLAKENDPAKIRDFAGTIEQTSNRISKVVKGMRALSRDSRRDPLQPVSLDSILQDAHALCFETARQRGVRLEVPITGEIALQCRGSEICQVLVNLLSNAVDAAAGSAIPRVWVEAHVREGQAEIAVYDNGPGVPADARPLILEPFFTTKEAGKGLGLGLSISKTIVESHGGRLWLDERSKSTRFAFTVSIANGGR